MALHNHGKNTLNHKNVDGKMHQQLPNVRKTTQSLALQKRPPIHGKNEANYQKCGMKDTGKTLAAPKSPNVKENGGKMEKRGCIAEWPTFLGIFLAKEVKTRFSKNGPLPNSNLVAHTLPIPCNN